MFVEKWMTPNLLTLTRYRHCTSLRLDNKMQDMIVSAARI